MWSVLLFLLVLINVIIIVRPILLSVVATSSTAARQPYCVLRHFIVFFIAFFLRRVRCFIYIFVLKVSCSCRYVPHLIHLRQSTGYRKCPGPPYVSTYRGQVTRLHFPGVYCGAEEPPSWNLAATTSLNASLYAVNKDWPCCMCDP